MSPAKPPKSPSRVPTHPVDAADADTADAIAAPDAAKAAVLARINRALDSLRPAKQPPPAPPGAPDPLGDPVDVDAGAPQPASHPKRLGEGELLVEVGAAPSRNGSIRESAAPPAVTLPPAPPRGPLARAPDGPTPTHGELARAAAASIRPGKGAPRPALVPYAAPSPATHPDTGAPLAVDPSVRPHMPWRHGRLRRPNGPRRPPTAADVLAMRRSLRQAADRATRGHASAATAVSVVLTLCSILQGRGSMRAVAIDYAAAARLRMPPYWWRTWALAGWRAEWTRWRRRAGSRWLSRRGLPDYSRLVRWRQVWAAVPWPESPRGRAMTAREWAVRTGEWIPPWLSGPAPQ